ncbi:hypothetical protein BGZ94_006424, partial [Podila epigama]
QCNGKTKWLDHYQSGYISRTCYFTFYGRFLVSGLTPLEMARTWEDLFEVPLSVTRRLAHRFVSYLAAAVGRTHYGGLSICQSTDLRGFYFFRSY